MNFANLPAVGAAAVGEKMRTSLPTEGTGGLKKGLKTNIASTELKWLLIKTVDCGDCLVECWSVAMASQDMCRQRGKVRSLARGPQGNVITVNFRHVRRDLPCPDRRQPRLEKSFICPGADNLRRVVFTEKEDSGAGGGEVSQCVTVPLYSCVKLSARTV